MRQTFREMPFLAVATALSFLQQPPATLPDRSGERDLKRVLAWAKGLDDTHVVIFKSSREKELSPMYPDSRIDLWLAGPKFRLETSNMWDGGMAVACDGSSVLSDTNYEWDPAVIVSAKGGVIGSLAQAKVETDDLSPFFAMMKGPESLDALVDKASPIKEEEKGSDRVISFNGKKLGGMRLYCHGEGKTLILDRIEYDNRAALDEQAKKFPEWIDPPDPGTLTRHDIVLATDKPGSGFFDVRPAKGRNFEDRRAKKNG
jgi:hypothetical protein